MSDHASPLILESHEAYLVLPRLGVSPGKLFESRGVKTAFQRREDAQRYLDATDAAVKARMRLVLGRGLPLRPPSASFEVRRVSVYEGEVPVAGTFALAAVCRCRQFGPRWHSVILARDADTMKGVLANRLDPHVFQAVPTMIVC